MTGSMVPFWFCAQQPPGWRLIEVIANLIFIFSIALVPSLGIVGDALGTAIPLSVTCIAFLPRHMKKQIGVPVGTFVRQA